jgi:DNA polymerase-3 subunit gamma/tau
MSQALYRQYRPQRFADVVGQDVAIRTLRNAIETDRVAHAYLFTGTRGTGKTTTAKLLAKAMNCENGPTTDPCGTCDECVAIAEGRSVNVLEIDAASNTGVQDVRDRIIDTVNFQPSGGTRRVYILDEAHMLSTSAFNALLKTIEEPPPHVLFIFCTTETHKMPATVRDRCQRLVMRSPGPDTLVTVLRSVCETEGITADEPAMRAIARAAQGSFRNALGTLEMLTTTFGTTIELADVLAHLGVVAESVLFDAADAVIDSDAGAVLGLVEQLVQDGVDLDQFARSLAEHLRMVLLQLHGLDQHAVVGDPARLATQASRADERRVLAAIDCIADAATRMRVGSDPRISVETALVRACQGLGLPLLALRLAALEQRETGGYGQPLPAAGASGTTTAAAAAAPPAAATPPPRPTPAAVPAAAASSRASSPATNVTDAPVAVAPEPLDEERLGDVAAWWPQVAQRVAKTPAHRPVLQQLTPESADQRALVLRSGATAPVLPKLREALTTATFEVTGRKLALEVLDPVATPARTGSTPAAAEPSPQPVAATAATVAEPARAAAPATPMPTGDEGIENLMTMFDATPVAPGDDVEQ